LTTIGVHCSDCLGTGSKKTRDAIGLITLSPCTRCGGLGGILAKEGDGEHRIAANIAAMKGYFDGQRKK